MLKLVDIVKDYPLDSDNVVHALKGVSLTFKENEFVAILGPSGCGKTTLLNIIGGLDRYTSGDLLVDEISTKNYTDKDWDNYRNKRIGIVFQHYNLIPHLSVLSNVEIALTLSGISKKQSKEKAKEALIKVGLEKEINKKPNQLSGGQMQRVAIARAIVNNPKIILADEPTGALDSETSVQIMEILEKLSKNHLVIMVTHNRELADKYASRIVSIKDGEITDDIERDKKIEEIKEDEHYNTTSLNAEDIKKEKTSMSFLTAMSISMKNLRTKKFRTIMTSIAGSIGIIGVALVLAVSHGFSNYIDNMQSETLAQFPISIEEFGINMNEPTNLNTVQTEIFPSDNNVIVREPIANNLHANDISDAYIEHVKKIDPALYENIQFNHSIRMNIMTESMDTGKVISFSSAQASVIETITSNSFWAELPASKDFILSQYDLINGKYPTEDNEMLLVVDKYNAVYSSTLKTLGFDKYDEKDEVKKVSFTDVLNHNYKVVPNNDYYTKHINTNPEENSAEGVYLKPQYELEANDLKLSKFTEYLNAISTKLEGVDLSNLKPEDVDDETKELLFKCLDYIEIPETFIWPEDLNNLSKEDVINMYNSIFQTKNFEYYTYPSEEQCNNVYNDKNIGKNLKIVGVIRPKETTMAPVLSYGVYYTQGLTDYVLDKNSPDVVDTNQNGYIDENEDRRCDIAKSYEKCAYIGKDAKLHVLNIINNNKPNDNFQGYLNQRKMLGTENYVSSIAIYPKDFPSKKVIVAHLDKFNEDKSDIDKVLYTDLASALTVGMGTMVDIVSYVLIAFASISLIVSSVMIGIITYTSVIERTKEIGILRSVGARKKDVGRLFKAEAVIIGLLSGIVGIAIAYVLCIPINMVLGFIYPDYGVDSIASLHPLHAFLLILLSAALTYISSVIPSRIAAKKDPVIALTSE